MKMTPKKLAIVFFLGILTDVVYAVYTLALTRNMITLALMFGFGIPYVVLIEAAWFADATCLKDRIKLTTAAAAGSTLGTFLILFFWGTQ